ncbi:MAG: tyrosine--tRNA ligase [bacterium]|nr:tyrosine--tRNA ligase [bacterium]
MDKIIEVLTRGVANIYPTKEALGEVLRSGRKIRLYNGIDPTGPQLHLGHMVVLRKLRQFQDLGHEVILLIGDFTARIGDPTDKQATRKQLTKEQVENNAANYKKMIGKILDLEKSNIRFLHNEEWSNKLKPEDMLELASNFTVSQLLERDMFQKRLKEGREIYVHEFLYPVFQAYDSVTMDVDLEIGGNDQTFNMLAGRTLMKKMKNKEKFVLAMKMLTNSTGIKMGKTEGDLIALDENPKEMFGKIMAWPDSLILLGFELLTNVSLAEIQNMEEQLNNQNINPMELKKKLAYNIVDQLYSAEPSKAAEEEFEKVFQRREIPSEDLQIFQTDSKEINIIDLLADSGVVSSRAEAKRLVEQGGVDIDGIPITNYQLPITPRDEMIIRVGKKKFLKISVNQ